MIKRILIFLIPIIAIVALGLKPHDEPNNNNGNNGGPYRINTNPNQVLVVDSKQLDANQISTWFRTNGSFNRDPSTGNAGFEWPKGSGKFARYASGLWLGCVVGNDTLTAVAEFSYDYLPGYIDASGNAQGQNDPNYRIYSIYVGNTTSEDYQNWPVSQGAYVDSAGNPLFIGTQTMFYVYTDGYPHASGSTSLASLKAQILQTNWSYNVNGVLGDIAFQEYRIINRSNSTWTDTYVSQWTDDDLGNAIDDKVGVDTVRSLGYTYNATNNDNVYGAAPPAVGFDFFRGPLVFTGNPADADTSFIVPGVNSPSNVRIRVGYKQLGLTVFNTYNNGSPQPSDPLNNVETYRVITGYWRLGDQWINPVTNQPTRKVYDGDPVAGTGWIMAGGNDRRFVQSSGPFTMAPGDTQTIVVAQVIAKGSSNLHSITQLQRTDQLAQKLYNNNFQVPLSAPSFPVNSYSPGNGRIYLSWGDTAEKISIPNNLSRGTYKFQGYNVYQIKSGTTGQEVGDKILIATFDVKDGITDISDTVFVPSLGTEVYYVVQKGLDNGISRYFIADKDYINNVLLSNGTPYSFVVTAYYYDSLGGPSSAPAVNETPITASNIMVITPQFLAPGTQASYATGDTIHTNQADLGVMPIVVNPLELIGATYKSTFSSLNGDTVYTLTRSYNNTTSTLITNSSDFSGSQDTATEVDGFIVVNQIVGDSGVVKDPGDASTVAAGFSTYSNEKAWTYEPSGNQWIQGPDTTAVRTAKLFTGKQFQSRSIGMSFPTTANYRGVKTRISANSDYLYQGTGNNPTLMGGPLRKFQVIFGQNSFAYRCVPMVGGVPTNVLATDTALLNTPYRDSVIVPFSVYSIDELDSVGGAPRQLNVMFIDADNNGQWDPDTTKLGKYQITYILSSSYNPDPGAQYRGRNPGTASPVNGFPSIDIMYAWVPRVIYRNGVALSYTNGDKLTVTPYRPTRPNFVPGYPVYYSWSVDATVYNNNELAEGRLNYIRAFPNPYYGGSSLETNPFNRFIYFSNLPNVCTIYIYTLDGVLVNIIQRNNTDPNNSMEQWDLENQNDIPVASGIYLVYVDAGSLGARTLKVAIFAPQERIDTF